MSEQPSMWPHWRDKKGLEEALIVYFPETLKSNRILAAAMTQLTMAKNAIEAEMSRLAEQDDLDG